MRAYRLLGRGAASVSCLVAAGFLGWSQARSDMQRAEKGERARIVLAEALPKMDGVHLQATLVEVNCARGRAALAAR